MEALQNCQQTLTLLDLLPESPERDRRELELRQLVFSLLRMTKGYSASETIEAAQRAAVLAEKSGKLAQLGAWLRSRGLTASSAGDSAAASAFADQALELALQEGSPTSLGGAYSLQAQTCYMRGDLAGAEKHFAAGLKFFDDPSVIQLPSGDVAAFAISRWNAWTPKRDSTC
jgi:hypothetical protein